MRLSHFRLDMYLLYPLKRMLRDQGVEIPALEKSKPESGKTPILDPVLMLDFQVNSPAHLVIWPPEQAVDNSVMNAV